MPGGRCGGAPTSQRNGGSSAPFASVGTPRRRGSAAPLAMALQDRLCFFVHSSVRPIAVGHAGAVPCRAVPLSHQPVPCCCDLWGSFQQPLRSVLCITALETGFGMIPAPLARG